jgi:hypothetical protein
VLGLYWDDAWLTDVGRDTFFVAGVELYLPVCAIPGLVTVTYRKPATGSVQDVSAGSVASSVPRKV